MPDTAMVEGTLDTPSGIPIDPTADSQKFMEDTVMEAIAGIFSNPANPLSQAVREQAAEAFHEARGSAVGLVTGLTTPTPGRTKTYYYCWAGGMGAAAGLNYYAAWRADESMLARVIFLVQGTALVAASAINIQKAQKVR
jgi:hypothetical protein